VHTDSLTGTTDSAAGGTALATGYKTVNGAIGKGVFGKDANAKLEDVQSLTELAASLGKKTAVMSTDVVTGATPSAFSAHAEYRDYADEILQSLAELVENSGTMIICDYDHYGVDNVQAIQDTVVDTLDKLDDGDNGFFIMYEEAHIDKHSHNNDLDFTFRAVMRFNQVIATFMEYAFYHPNTFVIITADHETGDLLPDGNGSFTYGAWYHTSQYVPVFAYGYGGEVFDDMPIENVQIPQTIASFWGVEDFGDQSQYKSLR